MALWLVCSPHLQRHVSSLRWPALPLATTPNLTLAYGGTWPCAQREALAAYPIILPVSTGNFSALSFALTFHNSPCTTLPLSLAPSTSPFLTRGRKQRAEGGEKK